MTIFNLYPTSSTLKLSILFKLRMHDVIKTFMIFQTSGNLFSKWKRMKNNWQNNRLFGLLGRVIWSLGGHHTDRLYWEMQFALICCMLPSPSHKICTQYLLADTQDYSIHTKKKIFSKPPLNYKTLQYISLLSISELLRMFIISFCLIVHNSEDWLFLVLSCIQFLASKFASILSSCELAHRFDSCSIRLCE